MDTLLFVALVAALAYIFRARLPGLWEKVKALFAKKQSAPIPAVVQPAKQPVVQPDRLPGDFPADKTNVDTPPTPSPKG